MILIIKKIFFIYIIFLVFLTCYFVDYMSNLSSTKNFIILKYFYFHLLLIDQLQLNLYLK